MNRRQMLAAAGAVLLPGSALAAPAPRLRDAARLAWIWSLPLIENAGSRTQALKGVRPGRLVHDRALTTPATQWVTTPNNDTLYSRAWLDLAAGPVRLTIPPMPRRYHSVALMDMYANNFAVLGTRTTGEGGGTFTIIGPHGDAADPLAIRSPTRWVWLLVRILADSDADLPAVHGLQDRIVLQAPAAGTPAATATRQAPWPEYFASVQQLMVDNPPPATDWALLQNIAPLGLTPRGGFSASRFSAAERAEIEAGVAEARQQVVGARRRQGPVADGWLYPKSNLGVFGQDYTYRAQVALGGLGALPAQEAMYMRALGPDGRTVLDSATPHRLHFAADQLPPRDAFWSLSMYEASPDGQFFFFDNPIHRYAIGDRTPGLVYGTDGGLDIWISRADPGGARSANWLPAPPQRPFSVVLRVYLPKPELLDGTYRLPRME